MNFELGYLFLVALVYLSLLFFIAYATDRGWIPEALARHPITYALSLGVYTTTWSYYGSVGFAEQNGFLFLSIYIGPTLAFILTPVLLAPLLRLVRDYQLTSLADLFAFRYHSQLAGILVTLFMLLGSLPYIALQIQAVTESTRILIDAQTPVELGLIFCATLTGFAILFGARHVSPREKHNGLVVAIAFESLVKLAAILAVALFGVFGVFGGVDGMHRWLAANPQSLETLYAPLRDGPWYTLVFLSFAAAFLLPRQFHMGFVENLDSRSLGVASWAFPLFLLLFNLAIPPILWAGQALGADSHPDYYPLSITLAGETALLPTIAFVGGISAASAMAIVATLALSSMALNHLLLPASYPDPAVDLYRWLLWGRRVIIGLIILTSYGLYVVLEHSQGLVQLGLISFVAVAQFLPGLMGVLFWRRATRAGFLWGLGAGIVVWFTSLMTPLLEQARIITGHFNLMETLGVVDASPWPSVTFWSLSLNTLLFVAVSLLTRQNAGEKRAIAVCFRESGYVPSNRLLSVASTGEFVQRLTRVIGEQAASREVQKALTDLAMDPGETRPQHLQRLRIRIERNLSGMLGPMMARMIVDSRLQADESTRLMLTDQMRFIEEQLEHSRTRLRGLARDLDALQLYHRQILQDLPLGACALSSEQEILNWNQAMERLTGIDRQTVMGSRVADLNAPWAGLLGAFLDHDGQHVHKTRALVQGRPRWFNLHKAAIGVSLPPRDDDSHRPWSGMVILVEDLTEVQTLEAELIHSARLASIGQLAAGVAHEIGNPVTGIACLTQNLREEHDPELLRESLDEILEQTARITAIVQTLLSYSHGGRPQERRHTRFSLRQCVADAQRLVQLSRGGKQLVYANDCPESLTLEADRQRLLQVFVNLLSNAADASEPGDRVWVSATVEDSVVVIRVDDQGTGIPEELRERIFEPFFTTKEPGQGTGLGLPLVYNIIRDHGGAVSIDANPGGGARFTVRLPASPPIPPAEAALNNAQHIDH